MIDKILRRKRVAQRCRAKIRNSVSNRGKMRLSVFKSNRHFSAQLIDDAMGRVVVYASTQNRSLRDKIKGRLNSSAVNCVADLFNNICDDKYKTMPIVFDKGGFKYMGIVAVFADKMREYGFKF